MAAYMPVQGNTRITEDGAYAGTLEGRETVKFRSDGMTVDLLHIEKVQGSDGDDAVTFGGSLRKNAGEVDLALGDDTLHLSGAQSYTLRLKGVETVTGDAGSRLVVQGSAVFETDGSVDIASAGRSGKLDVTFTGIAEDATLDLGPGRHTVRFGEGFQFSTGEEGELVVVRDGHALTFGAQLPGNRLTIEVDGQSYSYAALLASSLIDDVAPQVTAVLATPDLVSDDDVGASRFTVAVSFDSAMLADGSADPVLAFDPDVASTLSFVEGGWNDAGTVYTATYTVADAGVAAASVQVGVSSARDLANNVLASHAAEVGFGIDTQNPTVTSFTEDHTAAKVSDGDREVAYSVTFSEAVSSLAASHLLITGGTLTAGPVLQPGGLSATFSVTANDNSTTSLSVNLRNTVTDAAGNALVPPTAITLPVDTVNPRVFTFVRRPTDGTQLTNADSLEWLLVFEEDVTGFDATDLVLTTSATATLSVTAQSANTYVVTASGGNLAGFNGDATLSFSDDRDFTDTAGNAMVNTTVTGHHRPTFTVDNVPPTVSVSTVAMPNWGFQISGTGMSTLNGVTAASTLDWSKFYISLNGGTARDITIFPGDVVSLSITSTTVSMQLRGTVVNEINAALDGGDDVLTIEEDFWRDLAGNVQLVIGGGYSAAISDFA